MLSIQNNHPYVEQRIWKNRKKVDLNLVEQAGSPALSNAILNEDGGEIDANTTLMFAGLSLAMQANDFITWKADVDNAVSIRIDGVEFA